MLLSRLAKYQAMTRSFQQDLVTDNKKVIEAHMQASRLLMHMKGGVARTITFSGVLSASMLVDIVKGLLPRQLLIGLDWS